MALKIILKEQYIDYTHALKITDLVTLSTRRTKLCLNFSKKCVRRDKTTHMFPKTELKVNTRNPEEFCVTKARTDRLKYSAIPYMQRLLNANISNK